MQLLFSLRLKKNVILDKINIIIEDKDSKLLGVMDNKLKWNKHTQKYQDIAILWLTLPRGRVRENN